ncbi:hypothetical protein BC826DRAFT_1082433 [Russula brevipes]|nr:hypothetical protein BC826DRAFT_1082433 [Russula brevipes]
MAPPNLTLPRPISPRAHSKALPGPQPPADQAKSPKVVRVISPDHMEVIDNYRNYLS